MQKFVKLVGVSLRKTDLPAFLIGMILPPVLMFLLFLNVKNNSALEQARYWELLQNGSRKLFYYLIVGLIEEFLFRGLLFGFLSKKIKQISLSVLLAALIFAIPHAVNSNASISILLIFSFIFGVLACEMRILTGSIWMSTAFHWTWNYSIVSVFMSTQTHPLIYGGITLEVSALALAFYALLKRQHPSAAF